MKYLGKITDDKDLVTKEFVDDSIEENISDWNATEDTPGYIKNRPFYQTGETISGSFTGQYVGRSLYANIDQNISAIKNYFHTNTPNSITVTLDDETYELPLNQPAGEFMLYGASEVDTDFWYIDFSNYPIAFGYGRSEYAEDDYYFLELDKYYDTISISVNNTSLVEDTIIYYESAGLLELFNSIPNYDTRTALEECCQEIYNDAPNSVTIEIDGISYTLPKYVGDGYLIYGDDYVQYDTDYTNFNNYDLNIYLTSSSYKIYVSPKLQNICTVSLMYNEHGAENVKINNARALQTTTGDDYIELNTRILESIPDTIAVTINNVNYNLPLIDSSLGQYAVYGAPENGGDGYDFSTCPISIYIEYLEDEDKIYCYNYVSVYKSIFNITVSFEGIVPNFIKTLDNKFIKADSYLGYSTNPVQNIVVAESIDQLNNDIDNNYMKKNRDYVTAGRKSGTTLGTQATAEGEETTASGEYSHAEGYLSQATGNTSHAEGSSTKATQLASHAEGSNTTASGGGAHAEGSQTTASGANSHAEGFGTTASDAYAHAEGNSTTANKQASHAEGYNTTAGGTQSHAEGYSTIASGNYSHAEGVGATASGQTSHAEGSYTTASGTQSHAEGSGATASGLTSHAEGNSTTASGYYSHAEGYLSRAQRRSQHVFGEYNIAESGDASSKGIYVEIVGNGGSDSNRSNARTLDWNGNEVLAGKLTVGTAPTNDMDVATKKYVDDNIPVTSNFMVKGVDYVTAGKKSGTNVGQYSTAEGYNTTASGNYSHAEGYNTVVLSVASHAEGGGSTAMWDGAHAEGGSTVSKGEASHAEGMNTIAKHRAQHVFGEANIEDPASGLGNTKGTYIEIVGNGSDNSGTITRSNARTLDWSGNEKLAGSITVGNSATMQYNSTDKSIDFVFI